MKILNKDTVEFSNSDIADLETVAYGGNPNPHETLFNSAGLPASPFTENPPKTTDAESPIQLLSMQNDKDGKDYVMSNGSIINKEVLLNLCHVRRSGYIFQITPTNPKAIPSPLTFRAYIPAEWKAFTVETVMHYNYLNTTELTATEQKGMAVDAAMRLEYQNGKISPSELKGAATSGKRVEATETNKDGKRFATFKVPVDGSWIIVSEAGKAAEFEKINRY